MYKKLLDTSEELLIHRYDHGVKLIRPDKINTQANFGSEHDKKPNIANLFKSSFNVYFLNVNSINQNMNENNAQAYWCSSIKSTIGKSIFDMTKPEYAQAVRNNDKEVLLTKELTIIEETAVRIKDNVSLPTLTIRLPWYSSENEIIGVVGCSIVLGKQPLADSLLQLSELSLLNKRNIEPYKNKTSLNSQNNKSIEKALPTAEQTSYYATKKLRINNVKVIYHKVTNAPIPLYPQQIRCLELLMQGYSAKRIANNLSLSIRTVEHYLENIRRLLGCRSSKELIAAYFTQIQKTNLSD